MSWKTSDAMSERVEFIGLLRSGQRTLASLCREFGISRPTGYKWAERFRLEGLEGLKERSRAPLQCSQQSSPSRGVGSSGGGSRPPTKTSTLISRDSLPVSWVLRPGSQGGRNPPACPRVYTGYRRGPMPRIAALLGRRPGRWSPAKTGSSGFRFPARSGGVPKIGFRHLRRSRRRSK